jgi:hypothetical protein
MCTYIPLTTMVKRHIYHDSLGNWAYKITAGDMIREVSTGYRDHWAAEADSEEALNRVYLELKEPEIDNLLELLQIAEEMMFREKNKNPQLALTHKMLQGVLRDYHEFSKVN